MPSIIREAKVAACLACPAKLSKCDEGEKRTGLPRGGRVRAGSAATAVSGLVSDRLRGFAETVRDLVTGAAVKHMDETGFRIGGKTQ